VTRHEDDHDRQPTSPPGARGARVHLWDAAEPGAPRPRIQDETLREGLQSAFVADPDDEVKIDLLRRIDALGIEHVSVGIPAAGPRMRASAERLIAATREFGLRVRPNAGGRTDPGDVAAIVAVAEATGVATDAFLFLGCSPVRQEVEGWDLPLLVRRTRASVAAAVRAGLETTFVLEDATRSTPEHLAALIDAALESGARHVCPCDTVGIATPAGTRNLIGWLRERVPGDVGVDWHGHDDRGLGLANALAAIEAGATRIHATALGLGERAGNTALEQLLVNLRLSGRDVRDLTSLPAYVRAVSTATGVPIPEGAPVVGRDVFCTATGVHAAAILKARERGDRDAEERVYAAIPASWVGREQEIRIGPMSGAANVRAFLRTVGLAADDGMIARVLDRAKRSRRVLGYDEIAHAVRDECEQDDVSVGVLW
jgi:2-isopropylmalate synthase